MINDNKHSFNIEECYSEGDPRDEQYVTYIVKYNDEASLLLLELRITPSMTTDDLMIREVYIPGSTSEPKVFLPTEYMIEILKSLTDEGLFEHIPAKQQDDSDYFYFVLNEPYKIDACFYQEKYYKEIDQWLRNFLVEDGTIARIIEMVDSDEN